MNLIIETTIKIIITALLKVSTIIITFITKTIVITEITVIKGKTAIAVILKHFNFQKNITYKLNTK